MVKLQPTMFRILRVVGLGISPNFQSPKMPMSDTGGLYAHQTWDVPIATQVELTTCREFCIVQVFAPGHTTFDPLEVRASCEHVCISVSKCHGVE
eukprot:4957212-Amphidinium_carterae.2